MVIAYKFTEIAHFGRKSVAARLPCEHIPKDFTSPVSHFQQLLVLQNHQNKHGTDWRIES